MATMTLEEFHAVLKAQGKTRIEDVTFKCPRCGELQSAQDLIDAGAGEKMDDVEKYLAFSCVGRWSDEKGCDWTLGGLFKIHELEVVTPDGEHHPRFMPASPETGENRSAGELSSPAPCTPTARGQGGPKNRHFWRGTREKTEKRRTRDSWCYKPTTKNQRKRQCLRR